MLCYLCCVKESRRLFVDPNIELPLIGYLCLRKELWDRVGQTFQVAGSKCIGKSCFAVQKKNYFGGRFTPFRLRLIAIFGQC